MIHTTPYLVLREVKYRVIVIFITGLVTYLCIYINNLTLLQQCFVYNYLLYYSNQVINISSFFYSGSSTGYLFKSYVHYYPEQEYSYNINLIYNFIYMLEFLFLCLFVIPAILYQVFLFMRPALYRHELKLFKYIFFYFIIFYINVFFALYIGNYSINLCDNFTKSDLNTALYFTYDLIQLLDYYSFIFLSFTCLQIIMTLYYIYIYKQLPYLLITVIQYSRISIIVILLLFFFNLPVSVVIFLSLIYLIINELVILTLIVRMTSSFIIK